MTKPSPTTSPPRPSTRRTAAAAVPPVASTSSTISTRSPGIDGVAVDLELVGAVLEHVLLAGDRPGQLAGLAHGHERGAEPVGDRRGEDEAAGLDADHAVDVDAGEAVGERVDREAEARPGHRAAA